MNFYGLQVNHDRQKYINLFWTLATQNKLSCISQAHTRSRSSQLYRSTMSRYEKSSKREDSFRRRACSFEQHDSALNSRKQRKLGSIGGRLLGFAILCVKVVAECAQALVVFQDFLARCTPSVIFHFFVNFRKLP